MACDTEGETEGEHILWLVPECAFHVSNGKVIQEEANPPGAFFVPCETVVPPETTQDEIYRYMFEHLVWHV